LQDDDSDSAAEPDSKDAAFGDKHPKESKSIEELKALKEKVESLDKELIAAKSELTRAKEENQKLSSASSEETENLKKQLSSAAEEKENLKKELGSAAEEKENLKKQVEQKADELSKKNEELTAVNAKADHLYSEGKQKEEELSKKNEELTAVNVKADSLSSEVKKKNEDIDTKTQEITDLSNEVERLKSVLGETKQNFTTLMEMYSDPSVEHFLKAKALKIYRHPGVEGAANKTFVYVLPSLRKKYEDGYNLKVQHAFVQEKLNSFIGSEKTEPWLPLASGLLVYGSFLLPFACAAFCLLRVMFTRRVCLSFCHLYFTLACAGATVFALVAGKDPLAVFAAHDASVYLFAQVLNGILFTLYTVLVFVSWCFFPESGSSGNCYRLVQLVGITLVTCAYYWYVWTPAMLDKMPQVDEMLVEIVGHRAWVSLMWLPYVPPLMVFFSAFVLEVIVSYPVHNENKISVGLRDMRDVQELASLVGKEGDIELGRKSS
jgi:predicted  nucleic acid-binding Zn-ribbon protein